MPNSLTRLGCKKVGSEFAKHAYLQSYFHISRCSSKYCFVVAMPFKRPSAKPASQPKMKKPAANAKKSGASSSSAAAKVSK